MNHLSPVVIALLSRLHFYLRCQKQNPNGVITLKPGLINSINTLSYQDLTTTLPMGENLFMHFVLILQKYDALDSNDFIFSALIRRSLFFRVHYPTLLDATTILLTSPNQNTQTPFQLIDALQNNHILHVYLEQITLHIAKPFMNRAVTNQHANVLYSEALLLNQCTPWCSPLALSFSFLGGVNRAGFRLLDNLAQSHITEQQFIAALDMLRGALIGGYISINVYKNILLTHPKMNHSLLHELIMAGSVGKFGAYLHAIEKIYQEKLIDRNEYKNVFFVLNVTGYRVVHQAINAPNVAIANYFLHWMQNISTLSVQDRQNIINITSRTLGKIQPRRDSRKYSDASMINGKLQSLRETFSLNQGLAMLNESRYEPRFFPNIPTEVEILSNDALSPISTISADSNTSPGWLPWNSRLLFSPLTLKPA